MRTREDEEPMERESTIWRVHKSTGWPMKWSVGDACLVGSSAHQHQRQLGIDIWALDAKLAELAGRSVPSFRSEPSLPAAHRTSGADGSIREPKTGASLQATPTARDSNAQGILVDSASFILTKRHPGSMVFDVQISARVVQRHRC